MEKIGGLGKGIQALIPENKLAEYKSDIVKLIKLTQIVPGRFQPRQSYDQAKLQELMNSIQESGVLYPILVREIYQSGSNEPKFELIAGERRFRAVKGLGIAEIPAIVKKVDDAEAAKIGLIENIQRQELTSIEEARAFQRLQQDFGMTQEQVAKSVGKERATITNTLRLLQLPKAIQEAVGRGELGMAHARALLSLPNEPLQMKLFEKIRKNKLSAHQVEGLVRQWTTPGTRRSIRHRDPHLAEAEKQLQQKFGTRVVLTQGRKRGWIKMEYYSLDDLNRLLGLLRVRF